MGRKRPLTMASERRKRKRLPVEDNPTASTVIVKEEPVDCITEYSGNTDEELENPDPGHLKVEVVCKMEEACQESKANQEEEEELQYPAAVFVKTEPPEFEETFHNEEENWTQDAFQDGEEKVPEPVVNDNEDSRTKKDSVASGSETGFLASIKQKIGKLFPGERPRPASKPPTLEGKGPYADFICTCNERFRTEEAAMAHTYSHDGAKPFRCLICREHFATKADALQDMESHIVNKYVRKKGNNANNLYTHLYVHKHLAGSPIRCYICRKNFKRKEDLVEHMPTHTEKDLFQCEVCAKFFRKKCHLFAHTQIHSGEKPFQCNICSKKFFLNTHLVKHMNVHNDHNTQGGKD